MRNDDPQTRGLPPARALPRALFFGAIWSAIIVATVPRTTPGVTIAQDASSAPSNLTELTFTLATSWTLSAPGDRYPLTKLCARDDRFYDNAGIAFDSSGRFLLANRCQYVFEGNPIGWPSMLVAKVDVDTGSITTTNAGAQPAHQLAFSADGERLLYVESGNGLITDLGTGAEWGILRSWVPLPGRAGTDPLPVAIAYGPDDVVFAYAEAGISRYGPLSQRVRPWEVRLDPATTLPPGAMFVDTVGDVYVTSADYSKGVQKFSADGHRYEEWRLSEHGGVTGPVAGFPGTDAAYVLDGGAPGIPARVLAFDPYGDVKRVLPVPSFLQREPRPRLAVGPRGEYALYGATQAGRDGAFIYDAQGTLLRTIFARDNPSETPGLALEPALAAGSAGTTAVMRPFPADVEVFDDSGQRISQWSTPLDTLDIAVDESGAVFLRRGIADSLETRIARHDHQGNLQWEHPFRWRAGAGLAAARGQVFVPEPFAGAVSVLDRETGELLGRLNTFSNDTTAGPSGPFLPYNVSADPTGLIALLDPDVEQWQLWDLDDSVIEPIARLSLSDLSDEIAYTAPTIGAAGHLAAIEGTFASRFETRWPENAISTAIAVFDSTGRPLARVDLDALGFADYRALDLDLDDDNSLHVLMKRRAGTGAEFLVAVFASTTNGGGEGILPTPTPRPPPEPANTGPCTVSGHKWATPDEIWLGEAVTVTLTVRRVCPETPARPADIILVVDASGSMAGSPARAAGAAVKAFVEGLDLSMHRVGVVTFADQARVRLALTNDPVVLSSLPDDWGAGGMTNMYDGMNDAISALAGRRPDAVGAIVFMTDGHFNVGPSPYGPAARARQDGISMFTVGLGWVDVRLLIEMAGDLSRYYSALTASELPAIYRQIAGVIGLRPGGASLDDTLHPDVDLVAGSIAPQPLTMPGPDIRWVWPALDGEWITMTYRVRPTRTGIVPTNSEAFLDYIDQDAVTRRYVYPIPTVLVRSPVTPTATATATPAPASIYLPINLKEVACEPSERPVDVALVIDASTSMLELTSNARPKIDAAREAAREFLAQLRLDSGDQATIVAFNSHAVLHQPLGASVAELSAGLDAIEVAPETCIVCGVETALAELVSERRIPNNRAAMIVLTDGRSNPRPVAEAVAVAAEAKAAGVVVFTIGLGPDLDVEALEEMASKPSYFYHSPNAEELVDIYAEIAVEIPCPADEFWGPRVSKPGSRGADLLLHQSPDEHGVYLPAAFESADRSAMIGPSTVTPTPSPDGSPSHTPTDRPRPTARHTPSPTPDYSWLEYVNYHRSLANIPPVVEQVEWNEGCALHSLYMVTNDIVTHDQDPGAPHYTATGALAGKTSVVTGSWDPTATHRSAIDWWMAAPFHMVAVLDPELTASAYGDSRDDEGGVRFAASLDVLRGLSGEAPHVEYPLTYPRDGGLLHYTEFSGNEFPDPLASCPGFGGRAGAPVVLLLGPGDMTPEVSASTLEAAAGEALEHCVIDETNSQGGLDARHAIVLLPRSPLDHARAYTATIVVNGDSHRWSFRTADSVP